MISGHSFNLIDQEEADGRLGPVELPHPPEHLGRRQGPRRYLARGSLADDFYRIQALDLHVGNTLTFEASPKFVRLYLPSGACGNTVIRFFTNLQHYYDSLVRAEDGNGRPLFEF
jgi:hypothetical protein